MCCEDLTKKNILKDITLLIKKEKYIVVVTSMIDTPAKILKNTKTTQFGKELCKNVFLITVQLCFNPPYPFFLL
jgi:hypothetical protein